MRRARKVPQTPVFIDEIEGVMKRPTVLVTETLDPQCEAWLAERARVTRPSGPGDEALRGALAEADGLVIRTYTRVDEALLAAAPRLRVVGRAGVGLENVDLEGCRRRGVAVVHTPEANTQAVVEYVWTLVTDWFRPRLWLDAAPSAAEWNRLREDAAGRRQLDELTLGILGVGRIGSRVGAVAAALGMRVQGYDLLGAEATLRRLSYPMEFVGPERLYREADILTLHVDARPANRGLVGAARLAELKPACLLVNTARGMVVDPAALAAWARRVEPTGGGALLDVHEPEPFGPDYPLLGLANVRLAPHLASRTETAMRNMSWVVRDVVEVLEGRPPRFPAP
jgi:phosphoglycerate dehydrogenase-like enzyme